MRGWVVLGILLWMPAAWSQTAVPVRAGDHPGFGRLVFDVPDPSAVHVVEQGRRLLVVLGGGRVVDAPAALPRNVESFTPAPGAAAIVVAPGARGRTTRIEGRLVLDVLDAKPRAKGKEPATAPPTPTPVISEPDQPLPAQRVARADAAPASPAPRAPEPAAAASAPSTPAPTMPVPMPTQAAPDSVRIKSAPTMGAAVFRRGEDEVVVLDDVVPVDADALRDALDGEVLPKSRAPQATVLSFRKRPDQQIGLTRTQSGWTISRRAVASAADGPDEPAGPLAIQQPGRVVAVTDPASGPPLLVLTSLANSKEERAGQKLPEFTIVPASLGLVIEPLSDQVDLRIGKDGAVISIAGRTWQGQPSPLIPQALARRFDLPPLAAPALMERLQAQLTASAAAPPRGRTRERLRAAESMIALGMGAEASAMLSLIGSDDPAMATDAAFNGLTGVAALLAGRLADAAPLADPQFDGDDEIGLWRGLRDMAATGRTAVPLGRLLPLVLTYPAPLQDRLLPVLAEAAVDQADDVSLPTVLAPFSPMAELSYARALQASRSGKPDAALELLDRLASGSDLLRAIRAREKAAEIRLAQGRLTPGQAAAEFERLSLAWRGDDREVAMRLRAAALRSDAGDWRAALEGLRDLAKLTADAGSEDVRTRIRARTGEVFRRIAEGAGPPVPPLDLVTLIAEHADSVPAGEVGQALTALLADKLVALDLPLRARPVLQTLMRTAAEGPVRAEIGARLAQLLLDGGSTADAQAALADSGAPNLSQALQQRRMLLEAKALVAQNNPAGAIERLAAIGTTEADDLRANLLAQAGDWPGSLSVLNRMVAATVPGEGPIGAAQQRLLLRQASAAVQAGDVQALHALQQRYADRVSEPDATAYRLLTAAPVRQGSDLPRAGRELALARTLPMQLSEGKR